MAPDLNINSIPCISVGLKDRGYPIYITQGFSIFEGLFGVVPFGGSAVVVTNSKISPLYAAALRDEISSRYSAVFDIVLPDGESYKNWESLNEVFDFLIQNHCDRSTVLYALGGGVIGDLTGFAASAYMRGIAFVQVPTTLLAQVDSSVGGKTAINHPKGKNMIGAFYQPKVVVCNVDALKTLPERELSAGLAEVIKYGPIFDMNFMSWLEGSIDLLVKKDSASLAYAIQRSCEIKAHVVEQDEKESGLRAILNFGHTFGHAIEAGMGYGTWLHGEGVAAGMVMAAELSARLGMVDANFVQRLKALIQRAGLPVQGPVLDAARNAERYLELMRLDKKSEGGEIRFILIDGPGKAVLRSVPDELVKEVINDCCA
ncbi:3-dehydroquinate synthase [Acidovorax sp. DW039]|uniref:3-dehydroquinate synthase n=1 Tax=Acidovorax sp. DW039 TaxID=3095606 RepID=UPI00308A84BB|nr:3-dehydroquinate synthase [Acidovorax sp. DW039]